MRQHDSATGRLAAGLAAAALLLVSALVAPPAAADTAPTEPGLPETVAADALPTVQVDGVVWDQEIVGNRVYVVGKFTTARPAGAAPGTSTVARANMLAYDLTTGALISSFAPAFNAQVLSVSASPDGRRLYVGGDFTAVGGATRYRVAAFDAATGALQSFAPAANARVAVVEATDATVYLGGIFTAVSGQSRGRVAAVSSATGALLPFAPTAGDGQVNAMALSPDHSALVVGGSFTTMNGSSSPGFGLARLDASTGASLSFPVNEIIRNAGTQQSIYNLYGDATGVYGVGYGYGNSDKFEGAFSADWEGRLRWLQDCHGDSYDVYTDGPVTYVAGHPYKCDTIGGYPETSPRVSQYANAYTNFATGTVKRNTAAGYSNFEGRPAPSLLTFFPSFQAGTFTGLGQATWTVTGNGDYVLFGGEFTRVNGVPQQGLVRMAVKEIAPNKQGPRLAGAATNPVLSSVRPGAVHVTWPGNHDRDNAALTYRLYRGATTSPPVFEQTVTAAFWQATEGRFLDVGLPPGSTQRYRLSVTDPMGNVVLSEWVSVTVADGTLSEYAQQVVGDGAESYWRMGEPSGTAVADWAGFAPATAEGGVTRGVAGAVAGDANTAAAFEGTSNGLVSTRSPVPGPNTFSLEAWVRTTSTTGGKLVGFGRSATGSSASHDRHVYMDDSGRIWLGVNPGVQRVVGSSGSYNDGTWHHVVATLGPGGMQLYVDGKSVAQRTDTTSGQAYSGYWRIGGDNMGSWPNRPTSPYVKGDLDDVALYPLVLAPEQVHAHFTAAGRSTDVPPPSTDAYGDAVRTAAPDFYWRLSETSGTTASGSGGTGRTGTYRHGVTLGSPGVLADTKNTAATFDGVDDLLSSDQQVTNPTTYSQELWFRTTTTAGGKLIGFGDQQDGTSSKRDRHVYMETSGRLTFGVYTGARVAISSPGSYNDGRWHHLVATQSSVGMRLYVDGVLVAKNTEARAQDYTGYWRVGGDVTWGPQPWFAGTIDEVAIYPTALSAQVVAEHFTLGSGSAPANQVPTAAFTHTTQELGLSVDGSGSADRDGSVASYAWDFGDGRTATGATATHSYAAAGTYTVRLTVTDDDGATGTTTKQVTVSGDTYVGAVRAAGPDFYWRLDETSGTRALGSDGTGRTGTYRNGVTLGAAGVLTAAANRAATFDGVDDLLSSDQQVSNPTTYSLELWFRTTTKAGGKLIGFGDQQDGTSSRRDRHVYMETDGRLVFGAYPGTRVAVSSPASYNDGRWHHLVATQSSAGMRLYVDAALVAQNTEARAQDYAGYWRVGGDITWGPQPWFAGTVDEVAVYPKALSAQVVGDHFTLGSGTAGGAENQAPTATFTHAAQDLTLSVDGSGSADPDGSIASYAWDFGDGGAGTGATATHTFAAAGTYTVRLTVTDDDGATGTHTQQVTVHAPAGESPTAAFTSQAAGLGLSVDGSTSSDPDGWVTSHAWDFGDGRTATGATASHTYQAAGTYTVTLTVTDNMGATGTATADVTVTTPQVADDLASDPFERTVASGWGTAPTGGAWTSSAHGISVDGGVGRHAISAPGYTRWSYLANGVSSADTDLRVTVAVDKAATGGGQYLSFVGRKVGSADYRARLKMESDASAVLQVSRGESALQAKVVPGLWYVPGEKLRVRVQVTGTAPTTLRAKAWRLGEEEPAEWLVSATDATAGLQAAGGIGLASYLSGLATNAPVTVTYDDLAAATPRSTEG